MKEEAREIRVRDVMVRDVAYVTVPGTREELMEVCKSRCISGAPVLKDGKVVGVVTRQDLLKNPDEEQIAMLMTRDPITIGPEESICDAARLMITNKIRRLPVVEGGRLVGIISVADIVRVMAGMDFSEPVGDYMGDETVAVWDETPLSVVGRIMELACVKAVPILNVNNELVGLITDRDLINAAVIEDNIVDSDFSLGSDEDEWTWEGMRDTMRIYYSISKISLPDRPVKEVMVKEVITATRNSGVSECAGVMSRNRFDQLPVISARGKLVGLLFDRDLLKVLVLM